MLTTNLLSVYGLNNGTTGTIIDSIFLENNQTQPSFIIAHFPSYTVPAWLNGEGQEKYIPIAPRTILSDTRTQSRIGYPIRLAYAMTIHKRQGQTLDFVVLDIGEVEKTLGITYVGASRARNFSRIAIVAHAKSRYDSIGHASLRPRLDEERRLDQLAVETLGRL